MSSSATLENVLYERKGAIAYVTLNRPKVCAATDDKNEGTQASLSKRAPRVQGR